jgi:hypothetical protein
MCRGGVRDNTVAGAQGRKQVGNPFETVAGGRGRVITDSEQVRNAARALRGVIETDWDEKTLAVTLLRSLCHLAETGVGSSADGWLPVDIANAAVELGERSWNNLSETDARKRVNDHWKKLKALWDLRIQRLPERLRRDDVNAVPDIDKLDDIGGRKNKVRYRLQFFEAPEADVPVVTRFVGGRQAEAGKETVGYYPVDLELPRFLRWIPVDGLVTSTGVGRLLVIVVTLVGGAGLIFALVMVVLLGHTPSAIAFLNRPGFPGGSWV